MAQFFAGTAAGPGAAYDFSRQLVSHLVANGWTVLQTINATTGVGYDVMLQGGALDPIADNRPILRLTITTITRMLVRCYADWDSTAQVGIGETGSSSYSYIDVPDSTFAFWIKANAVAAAYVVKNGANYYHGYMGFLRRGLSNNRSGLTKTTASLAVGANSLPVASDMTGKIKVGQRIHILSNSHNNSSANKLNGEMITVTSITANAIGCSNLTKAYDSGAYVGENPFPCVVGSSSVNQNLIGSQGYIPWLPDGTPSGNVNNTVAPYITNFAYTTYTTPSYTQDYIPGIQSLHCSTSGKGSFLGYPYHYETCGWGVQTTEDIMDDGEFTYIVVGTGSGACLLLGPREV